MLNAAPSATTGPIRAEWVWISQLAVFITCQMPVKFGLPSLVRGTPDARLGHRRRGSHGDERHGRPTRISGLGIASHFPVFAHVVAMRITAADLQRGRLLVSARRNRSADLDRLPDEH